MFEVIDNGIGKSFGDRSKRFPDLL
jgi:hypothetical protein